MGRRSAVAAMVALVGSFLMVGSASAQTGYPPGPCTVTASVASLGNFNVGQTFTATLIPTCAWTSGTNVTVTVNGVAVGTKVAKADGTVTITVRITSATSMEVDDPVSVPTVCGQNTIVAGGASKVANANVVHTTTFGVVCPAATTTTTRIALTGANILRMVGVAGLAVLIGTLIVSGVRKRRRRVPELV